MSDWVIYSIGDSALLEQVLISVAMITGSGDFLAACSIGLLIGFLIVFVQSLFQGAKTINVHQVFLGWLLYSVMFVPTSYCQIWCPS
ncbi:conjugal transfer protein TraG N-terminal domain-containing protein, partial [Roseibium sp. RKSG952]|uniref:conjugal transfer protein TraG N-terminal domain-containing protein n=1 Tax=Roseibium sp. RKSG952 TaxID=2529384 RepID=UPI0012BD4EE2